MKVLKAIIVGVITFLLLSSCSKQEVKQGKAAVYPISIVEANEYGEDGSTLYNVLLSNGTELTLMYIEEINSGFCTGKWEYNDNLHIAIDYDDED